MARSQSISIDAGRIEGVKDALSALEEIRREIREELPGKVQKAAKGIATSVQASFPSEVYGIDTRTERIIRFDVRPAAKVDGSDRPVKSVGDTANQVPLFRVVVEGQNAVFADLGVGRYQDSQVRLSAIDLMNARYGGISRFAWPAFRQAQGKAQDATVKALEALADRLSTRLKRRRGG